MPFSVGQKVLLAHLMDDEGNKLVTDVLPEAGTTINLRITDTLTQDATGTFAYIEFEAMKVDRVKAERCVSYVDHQLMQADFKNADDHDFLRSCAAKFGIKLSRAGNGICHQVHLERFARPGKTLIGSDSHTPTAGGVGQIALGAGGLNVTLAMAGQAFPMKMPKFVGVHLTGKLNEWCTAKDVILEILRRDGVRGGKGFLYEYYGEGVKNLSVPQRATITNMGTELGATTSIFPSDEATKEFMIKQEREEDWCEMTCDEGVKWDREIEINLADIVPMVAKPHSPGNVCRMDELEPEKVNQVVVGSCTNSSYEDLMAVASMLKGKTLPPHVSMGILPGSRQVLSLLARNGALADMVGAGCRILESGCGGCIGLGFSPRSDSITVRTFNRNFHGRCGTKSAGNYLVSPETATACALKGCFTDPRTLGLDVPVIPEYKPVVDDSMIIPALPPKESEKVEIIRGPNIKPMPTLQPVSDLTDIEVSLYTGDDITTDDIMMAGAKVLPFRSNIPELAKFCFNPVDPTFPERALALGRSVVIGGFNYGQGSSREHAAIAPLHLGVRAVIAKTYARIHAENLAAWGIVPLEFLNKDDYADIKRDDHLDMPNLVEQLNAGKNVQVTNKRTGNTYECECVVSGRGLDQLMAGGALLQAAQ
ncbi:aconitase, putative [Kipferlia bialata]|uniref:Aconitase, putative n=1 Tax=Kipferlia bialata TaxID=797122 RepID=A0A391NQF5_9EUKA|nr:aconitase, putative [Kipferlia bialata]|eukprot:g3802.t1